MAHDPFDFAGTRRRNGVNKNRRTILNDPPKKRKPPKKGPKPRLVIPPLVKLENAKGGDPLARFSKNLRGANSADEVCAWFSNNDDRFEKKAEKGLGRSKVPDHLRAIYHALRTDPGALSLPTLSNREVRREAFEQLGRELIAIAHADPENQFALVTIICGSGATSHFRPEVELAQSHKRARYTLSKMAPHYFGITELALFNSMTHEEGGRVIQRHEHALIWGKNIIHSANALSQRHADLFKPNLTGAPIIDVKPVARDDVNLMRMAAYLFKRSFKAKNWNPPKDGKSGAMNGSEKGDRFACYLRLLQLQTMLTVEDVTFASGQGQGIRSAMIKHARSTAETSARSTSVVHPDALDRYWADTVGAMGKKQWSLPVIIRQK